MSTASYLLETGKSKISQSSELFNFHRPPFVTLFLQIEIAAINTDVISYDFDTSLNNRVELFFNRMLSR